MKYSRVLMVKVEGETKHLVDRAADLIAEDTKTSAVFIQSIMEVFADQDRTGDDPPVQVPTIEVTNVREHGKGKPQ